MGGGGKGRLAGLCSAVPVYEINNFWQEDYKNWNHGEKLLLNGKREFALFTHCFPSA